MMLPGAPFPPNEHERLAALHALHILDTPTEERFDRITNLARQIFQVPIALMSLVDKRRQWFKSCFGLSVSETPRGQSFCAYTLLDNQPLVVPDALADPRFAQHPLVIGDPFIRFYAGCPLQTSKGYILGTLCIIDHVPRQFDQQQLAILQDLTRLIEREIGLSSPLIVSSPSRQDDETFSETSHSVASTMQYYSQDNHPYLFSLFEHVSLGVAYLGLDGRWLEMNESLCHITGYRRDELRQMTLKIPWFTIGVFLRMIYQRILWKNATFARAAPWFGSASPSLFCAICIISHSLSLRPSRILVSVSKWKRNGVISSPVRPQHTSGLNG